MSESRPVALITGSSTGIGAAVAFELGHAGYDIILHGRSESEDLLLTKNRLLQLGGRVEVRTLDFLATDRLPDFARSCWQCFGCVDVLVNNAGGDVLTGDWAGREFEAKLNYLLQVDVVATLLLSRSFGQRMQERSIRMKTPAGSHSIINIGWDQAEQGMGGDSGEMFSTTKGAIMSMSRSLAQSFSPHVRVNCVAPGWIQTEWGDTAPIEWQRRASSESLMNRWGRPQDVAATIVHLAGTEASFISGQVINVNGGFRYFKNGDDES